MKASLTALAAALLIAACPLAQAASSVDLAVTGSITPSACTPSISSNGLVDYGKISFQDLHPTKLTFLPKTVLKLAVDCEGASLFGLASMDNRLVSSDNSVFYVLGLIEPRKWIGAYLLSLENILTDDPSAIAIQSRDNGADWYPYSVGEYWANNIMTAFGRTLAGQLAPTPIKTASMDLIVEPYIHGQDMFPVMDAAIPLDGSATLELRYL